MKVAVLSDIHGNSFALEAVLKEVVLNGIEKLLILGDCVGYYHHPDRVFDLLSKWNYELIKGNHEEILNLFISGTEEYKQKIRDKYGLGYDVALEKLSENTLFKLANLKDNQPVKINGITLQMCHGSPRDICEYVYPDSRFKKLVGLDNKDFNFILMGHTHYPFSFNGKHSHLINVGSVGQSRVMGGVANWGVINLENKSFVQKHTIYNVDKLLNELKQMKHTPEYLMTILKRNRN